MQLTLVSVFLVVVFGAITALLGAPSITLLALGVGAVILILFLRLFRPRSWR